MARHRSQARSTLIFLVIFALIIYSTTYIKGVNWNGFSSSSVWPDKIDRSRQQPPPSPPKYLEPEPAQDFHTDFLFDNEDAPPPSSMEELLSRPVYLPPQSETLEEARNTFRKRYSREPPTAFDSWFSFAKEHQCVIDNYDFINYDFAPWRELKNRNGGVKPITRSLVMAASRIGRIHSIIVARDRITITPMLWYDDRMQYHLKDFFKVLPDAKLLIPHNALSEPRILPPQPNYVPLRSEEAEIGGRFRPISPAPQSTAAPESTAEADGNSGRNYNRRITPTKMEDRPFVNASPNPGVLSGVTEDGVEYSSKRGFMLAKKYCPDHPLIRNYTEENPRVDHSFFNTGNSVRVSESYFPIVGQSRIHGCYADIQWASHYSVADNFMNEIDAEDNPLWEDKKSILFWRGSTTGQNNMMNNWNDNHRVKAWHVTRQIQEAYPDRKVIDFEFTGYAQCDRTTCVDMERSLTPKAARESRAYHWQHKYLLVLDGNVFANRLPHYLYGGSLVFLTSIFQHTFEEWLKPWVHYVPLKPDLSNLEERLRWAWEHDDLAKQIAENGRNFAANYIRQSDLKCWTYRTLIEYNDLYNDD